ncbi:MAG TPA: tRNA (adenosine(37)-N6)-threonylcarbamoyltransferase complex ATPase subunit type 1 TsaE [Nitrospira sp.]|nr:tRNA (adenosine(37)-N6)-threonylcarbamoyltransferase complex ATPase subunit type 1 TsaE [Nitrospira sp.]
MCSSSLEETDRLGRLIGRSLHGGETLALFGPLGSGKTALVRGIAAGLGAPPSDVSSPTFVLIHEYRGRLPLAHVDLYRLESPSDLESTGLTEYLSGPTVTAIEWAVKGMSWLPDDRLEIELCHVATESRRISLRANGPVSGTVLSEIERRVRRTRLSAG